MLFNYLKITIRNLLKSKIFSFINISGLAIGMAGTLLILMYVVNELSYENFHAKRNSIYRVAVDFGQGDSKMRFAAAMSALGPALTEQIPEVENAVRFKRDSNPKLEYNNKEFQEQRFFFVDPTVFDVFSFNLVAGNQNEVLSAPFAMVITEETAYKYFGKENPIGKVVIYNKQFPMKVTGVIENIPANTHLKCDFLVSLSSLEQMGQQNQPSWNTVGDSYTYLLLSKNTLLDGLINKMDALLKVNTSEFFSKLITFKLQNLSDIYMISDAIVDLGPKGNITYVYVFSIVAFLVLIIACFNFMNLSTARSLKRIKEVGMRKVLGANRLQLIKQFLGESLFISSLAIIIALVLFELVYPKLNLFLENSMVISQQKFTYLYIMIPMVVIIVGFFAGIYPAFFLSRYQPVDTMTNRILPGSKRSMFRKALVIAQFSMSIILIAGTSVLFKQLHFMKNTELGFNKKNVILTRYNSRKEAAKEKYFVLKDQLLQHPEVISVSGAYTIPGITSKETKTIQRKDVQQDEPITVQAIAVDYDYAATMGLDIIQGRDFSKEFSTDEKAGILLNQAAVKQLQLTEPLGEKLIIPVANKQQEVTVLGVVRDFHVYSLQERIEPILLYINPESYYNIAIRIQPENAALALANIESTWKRILPDRNFEYNNLENVYNRLYLSEEKMSQLLALFSFLAIFIACLGLFGLVSFTTERRNKEIGVRKVLGASDSRIVLLLTKDLTLWVLISNLIAWPVAYIAMNTWLQNYAYRINLDFWTFLLAGVIVLSIALLTVSLQAIKAALANPVEALKYE